MTTASVGLRIAATLALLVSSLAVDAAADVIVPFSTEHPYAFYDYEIGDIWSNVPTQVDSLSFDDSGWLVGTAPFGVTSPSCSSFVPQTEWLIEDEILVLRVKFFLPAGAGAVHVTVLSSDDYQLSMDGVRYVSVIQLPDCPYRIHIHVRQLDTSLSGEHIVVICACSNGPWGGAEPHQFLNVEVRAPLPTSVADDSWSVIKGLFR